MSKAQEGRNHRGALLEHDKGGAEQQQMLHGQVVDGHVCAKFVRTWISSCPSGSRLDMREEAGVSKVQKQHSGNITFCVSLLRSGRAGTQPLLMFGSQ